MPPQAALEGNSVAYLVPIAAPKQPSQHTLVWFGNTGTGLNKLLPVCWCLLRQGMRTWMKRLEPNKKTNLRSTKAQWSSQSPARTQNNSPPMGKTTIPAERTHFSYLSSSFLPMKQFKQAHLHREVILACLRLDMALQGSAHQLNAMVTSHQIHSKQH